MATVLVVGAAFLLCLVIVEALLGLAWDVGTAEEAEER